MNLVNSHSAVAGRVRDIQAQAAAPGRARALRGTHRPGTARRVLSVWACAQDLPRPQTTIKMVEEL